MKASRTLAALVACALGLGGCAGGARVETSLVPASRLVVTQASEQTSYALDAPGASFRVHDATLPHRLRITAPGRSTLTGSFSSMTEAGVFALHTRVNTWCRASECSVRSRRHPITWLARDSRPFELPAEGAGVVVTADRATGAVAVITPTDPASGFARGETRRVPLRAAGRDGGTLPEVIGLPPGNRYSVVIGAEGYEAGSMDIEVEPGTFVVVHASLARARESHGSFVR